jgi:hypothetical protein
MDSQNMMDRRSPLQGELLKKRDSTAGIEFDLVGIEAIEGFLGKRSSELLNWRRYYQLPITKIDGVFCANKAQVLKWLSLRGATIRTLSETLLDAWYRRDAILNKTRPARYPGKVLRNISEISAFFSIPLSTVQDLCNFYVKWPIEPAGKKQGFEISADDMQDFFEMEGIKCGTNESGCGHDRSW